MVILTSQSWLTRHHGLRDRIVIFGNFNNFLLASVQTFSYEIRFVNCIDIQKYARIISDFWNGNKWWFQHVKVGQFNVGAYGTASPFSATLTIPCSLECYHIVTKFNQVTEKTFKNTPELFQIFETVTNGDFNTSKLVDSTSGLTGLPPRVQETSRFYYCSKTCCWVR